MDVVSGKEEAKLGYIGALDGQDGAIIDVGGASTEITVVADYFQCFYDFFKLHKMRCFHKNGIPLDQKFR